MYNTIFSIINFTHLSRKVLVWDILKAFKNKSQSKVQSPIVS